MRSEEMGLKMRFATGGQHATTDDGWLGHLIERWGRGAWARSAHRILSFSRFRSAVASCSVAFASSGPALSGACLGLNGVFSAMAPVAEAFKVIQRVIHEIAVLVVNLAASGFAAPFARLFGLQESGVFRGDSPRSRWLSGSRGLAGMAAIGSLAKGVTLLRHPVGIFVRRHDERLVADGARLA